MTIPRRCTCRDRAAPGACAGRRGLLGLAALAALGGVPLLAGCERAADGEAALQPVEVARGTSCELDGMLLADYPGPKAQLLVAGRATPMFFCDTVELFDTLLSGERALAVRAVFVQDMGRADWEQPVGHWIDARAAFFVVGGRRHGSMGPTIGSFAAEADASAFASQWGGKVLRFAEIRADMVDLSGGGKHDGRM
jgi:copper chaperone NosL